MTGDYRSLTGQWLGNYRLLGLLKHGGMADVYRGREIDTNREVAVKVLAPALASLPNYVESFRNEIAQVRKLDHPNIVPIEAFGEQGFYLYLVMPLFRSSLRDVLTLYERLEPIEALRVGQQIASALTSVHALGLIHRDVKPGNILLTDDRALLTDFGIVRQVVFGERGQAPTLAGTGLPIGTIQYMAPEQLAGQPVDYRVDLYALGGVLYEMLSGRPPYVGNTPYAVGAQILNDPVVSLSTLNPAVRPELEAVIMGALARDPNDRYPNADSMRQALRQVDAQSGSGTSILLLSSIPGHTNRGNSTAEHASGSLSSPYGGAQGTLHSRTVSQPVLLAALASVLLGLSLFCVLGLAIMNGNGARGEGAGTRATPQAPTLSSDATYAAMAATATNYALTPTVTTGPGTPTPTPRPPLPTPMVTVGPGTPTHTPYPTDTPVLSPTATDLPTDTPTDTPTEVPTDTPPT